MLYMCVCAWMWSLRYVQYSFQKLMYYFSERWSFSGYWVKMIDEFKSVVAHYFKCELITYKYYSFVKIKFKTKCQWSSWRKWTSYYSVLLALEFYKIYV